MDKFEEIDNELSNLLQLVDEDTYNNFLLGNPIMKIYDQVVQLENHKGILTDDILNKIYNLVKAEVELYK